MNTLQSFIRKEFKHILRDPLTLLIMFAMPVVLMFILSYAVSTEINNVKVLVWDKAHSPESARLIEEIDAGKNFTLCGNINSENAVDKAFRTGACDVILVIPGDFASEPQHSGSSDVQVLLDATNPNQATTISNYMQAVITNYNAAENNSPEIAAAGINLDIKMLYNPQMKSSYNIVPGLQGMILLLICSLMTSIAVVREKESGTMEILLVSPVKPSTIIFAKAIPYLVVSIVCVIFILLLSVFVMHVPIHGNLLLLALLSLTFIFTSLALGLLISSITDSQQTAMMLAGMGLMMPSMLLSGLIFPISGMPAVLQWISAIVPARWFIDALRNVMIKGLGFDSITKEFSILLGMCIFFMFVSIKKFKARL